MWETVTSYCLACGLVTKSTALCIVRKQFSLFEVEKTNCDHALTVLMTLVVLGVRGQARLNLKL